PDPALKHVIANIHERRRRDVEAWITQGIAAGEIDPEVAVRSVAAQFCATIIGIVYQWLATPQAGTAIKELHEGLKQQMALALRPAPRAHRSQMRRSYIRRAL
ncbi:MAG: hypothetical protein ACREXT_07520, partial [Gammaproteobacteria bacterium]